jgi:hypothetical protein
MVQFFTVTLCISIIGIMSLFVLKQIELSTGSILFSAFRPKINLFFKTCLVIVERVIPGLAREGAGHVFSKMREAVKVVLARMVLKAETMLQDWLRFLKDKFNPRHARGEASAFLKEVGEYKKQLENEDTQEDKALY